MAARQPSGPATDTPTDMPAALLFGRAWRFASDDLPIPAALSAAARATWIGSFAAIKVLYLTPDAISCTGTVCSRSVLWAGQVRLHMKFINKTCFIGFPIQTQCIFMYFFLHFFPLVQPKWPMCLSTAVVRSSKNRAMCRDAWKATCMAC